jgi:hypothetical protein
MRVDAHIRIARASVRDAQLTRHVAQAFDPDRAFVVTSGLGLPRTWALSTGAVVAGFARGLEESRGCSASERLGAVTQSARATLAEACDQLVEQHLPDATLAALLLDEGQLHVMSVGPCRVYVQHGGRPKRLTSREEPSGGGLLRVRPATSSTPLEPGDLVLAGSVTAFSAPAVAKAMELLAADPRVSPGPLASLLVEPANEARVGAAAVVLRVL